MNTERFKKEFKLVAIKRLQTELKLITEARDFLTKAAEYSIERCTIQKA